MRNKLIYLISPYTHKDPEVRELRYRQVEALTAELMKEGRVVVSPITHCHNLAKHNEMPTDFDFWQHWCLGLLAKADEVLVYCLPGWEESKGVQAEIKHAGELGIPIDYTG